MYEDAALDQIRSTSTTTYTEELKSKIVYKIQSVHDCSEGIYANIQSTVCPTEDDMDVHVTYLYITSLRAICNTQSKSHFPNLYLYLYPKELPAEFVHLTINSIQSKATTPEEQAICNFNILNLKRISTWDE